MFNEQSCNFNVLKQSTENINSSAAVSAWVYLGFGLKSAQKKNNLYPFYYAGLSCFTQLLNYEY